MGRGLGERRVGERRENIKEREKKELAERDKTCAIS
jgi:hypothetical protein